MLPFCQCGCGKKVTKINNKYINGHSRKGKKHTPESVLKMKNKVISEETKIRMKEVQLGKKRSEKHKRNIGNSVKGEKNGFYKKNHSEETKIKMKNAWEIRKKKKDYDEKQKERGKKQSISMKKVWKDGVYNTDEYREKVSIGVKKVWNDSNSIFNSDEWRNKQSKITKELFLDSIFLKHWQDGQKASPNKLEEKFNKILCRMTREYKFTGDFSIWIGGKNPDFINEKEKKIIELFGDYWHSKEVTGINEGDEEKGRIDHFSRYGYKTLVIWENELKDKDILKDKIRRFIYE